MILLYIFQIQKHYESINDSEENNGDLIGNISPETGATLFSRLFFSWFNPMINLGTYRPISKKDLWNLPNEECCAEFSKPYADKVIEASK